VTGLISLLPRRLGDRVRWAGAVVFLALAVALPPLAGLNELVNPDSSARFTIFLGTGMLVLALWAISYNLMLGYAGLVSFAHAAYYGIGAYTVAIFYTKTHGASLLLGLALAPLVTVVFGFVTGLVALRAVRLYFSLLTLAISQLLFAIASQWYDVTGGDNGLHGLTVPDALTDYTTMYYFVAAVVLVCLLLMFVIVRSPFGAALAAIRENRERAASVGINVKAYELAVFTVAALFAGVAGGLYAFYQQEAFPQMLFWTSNADPVIVALLGGIQSFLGPALGAVVLTMLRSYISKSYAQYVDIVLGAIVLALVLLAPGGLVSLPELFVKLRHRFRRGDQDAGVIESEGEAFRMLDVQKAVEANAIQAEEVDRGSVLLKLEGLTKRFGGLRAVEEVNLEVRQGDRHAIIGPNGAGKSTLFNLLSGRLKPTAGRVWFDGRDITGKPVHTIAKAGIGRAFQITSIFPKLTVRENLQYAMLAHRGRTTRPFGIAARIFREEAMTLLEAVGLGRYADLPAGQLSHGDQRAIELAISLALGSRMILLDEPTAGMSPFETQKAMELVRRIATERRLTLLFCEHDMEVVFGTARTVTVMHLGRVLTQGTPEQVRHNSEVRKVYLGELEVEEDTA
jgi:ABC-type branched-subunit amino acid transport system ATPase component/ABC-type branched-subunit amino acid transport system permease subunit